MLTRSIPVLLLLARVASADSVSLPWQLHPVTTDTLVRADSTAAVFDDANGNLDISETTALSGSYQLTEHWAPMLRFAIAGNNAPGAALDGSTFANPIAGATYTSPLRDGRLSLLAATTLPIGTGGGDDPDPRAAKTNAASITARPADEAMFEVDYATAIAGADLAVVKHGVTLQGEAMLQQSIRVHGAHTAAGADAFRTLAVLGAHIGTFLGSHVSLGADLLYQRWLSHPTELDMTGADVGRLTVSAGVRVHFHVGTAALHPGLSYTRGLDATAHGPLILTNRTNAVALDLPVSF